MGRGGRGEDDSVGRVEIGPVERVEDFGAELQAQALANFGVLQDREFPGAQARADVRVPADIPIETAG
jgi:hypothetical protein